MNISGDFLRSGEVQETSGATQAAEVTNQPAAQVANEEAAASSHEAADTASLSTAGAAASAASSAESEVRSEKVSAIQAALVGGDYNVPSTEVANTVINHMLGGTGGSAGDEQVEQPAV